MKKILLSLLIFVIACNKPASVFIGDEKSFELLKETYTGKVFHPENSQSQRVIAQGQAQAQFYQCGATCTDTASFGSNGCRFTVPVKRLTLRSSKIKSCWIAFWYNVQLPDGSIQNRWIQLGYLDSKDWGLMSGFYVYDIYPRYGLTQDLQINYFYDAPPLKYNTVVTFELKNNSTPTTRSTWWTCSRNGVPFLEVDLKTETAARIQIMTESYGDDLFTDVLKITGCQILKNGTWRDLPSGVAEGAFRWPMRSTGNFAEFNAGGKGQGDVYLW